MISQFDIFKLGKTVCYADRAVRDYNQIENNGIHELYINATGKDITYLSELMQYIQNNDRFADAEDCLQDKCAKEVGADYIVTCNVKDFNESEIPAITPAQFLKLME